MTTPPVETLDQCDDAYDELTGDVPLARKRELIDSLLAAHQVINFNIGRGSVFWRARISSPQGFATERELSYPPPALTGVGRLNEPGQPCLYLASRRDTAMAEISAIEGQHVHLAGFRILPDKVLRLIAIGEWLHVHKTGYLRFGGRDPDNGVSRSMNSFPYQQARLLLYVDALLGAILARGKDEDREYLTTRLIAKALYAKLPADGICYPSVRDPLAMNVAVKREAADKCMTGVCAQVVHIIKIRRLGIYEFDSLLTATGVDHEGSYKWQEADDPRHYNVYGLTPEELKLQTQSLLDLTHGKEKSS